jgi:nucleotide-binding universal stress UspA family protein
VGFEAAPQVFDGHQIFFRNNAAKVRMAFESAMSKNGLAFDFAQVEANSPLISDEVLTRGSSADIILISATDAEQTTGVELDCVERIVMGAGRPAIVLPVKGKAQISLDEIIVGWNNSREAARAAYDALPLLKKAKTVRIVRADPQKEPELRHSIAGADLAQALARHGVKAIAEGYPTGGADAGQALLQRAEDTGAGLVVMGAYGHSRLREFVFGGATQFVLSRMTMPVLMSH